VPAVVWSMILKFLSEKGEIFEDTPRESILLGLSSGTFQIHFTV